MIAAGVHVWRLSEPGDDCLGLACTREGLFLGRTPLIERRDRLFVVRVQADLERLLGRGYDAEISLDGRMSRLGLVASALEEGNLCLAQIGALHLCLPDLPSPAARLGMETEDALIKAEYASGWLTRGDWDPAKHPRTGAPPNPGWFAPTGGPDLPTQTAQGGEEERAPEELLDPTAPLRHAQWQAGIGTLREIDPGNPQLSSLTAPGWVPSQADLDTLDAAITAAELRRVKDKIMPGGVPIGAPGTSFDIREVPGGIAAARDLFDYLRVGGSNYISRPDITVIKLPGNSGYLTFRPVSRSRDPAIDINLPDEALIKLHFPSSLKKWAQWMNGKMSLDEVVENYLRETEVDYVSLPQVSSAARHYIGAQTAEEIRRVSLDVVRGLYERGLRPGDYWGGDFDYWPDEGCQAALDRIEREWIKAGADPNLAEPICWFAPRPPG